MNEYKMIALASMLCAGNAFAQNAATPHKWYVGLDVGQSTIDRSGGLDDSFENNFDDTSTSFTLRAGYRFSRFFALEAGYVDFGDFGDAPGPGNQYDFHSSSQGFMVNAMLIWPVARHLELDFLGGGVWLDKDVSVNGPITATAGGSGFVPKLGLGIAVPVNEHLAFNLEWTEYVDFDLGIDLVPRLALFSEGDTQVLSAGVRWKF